MSTVVPCKRPKVTVDQRGTDRDAVDANCHVPGCGWTYPADKQFLALKSDAGDQATRHRGEHRAAVPKTHIGGSAAHGFHGSCFDAEGWAHWNTAPGCTTRTDVDAAVAHHLSAEHGLVVCP